MKTYYTCLLRRLLAVLIVSAGLVQTSLAGEFDDSQVSHISYPGWFDDDPFLDLAEALDRVRTEERRGLMILFTTEGCSYCDLFIRESLGAPELASRVLDSFVSVGLEIFDDREMTTPAGVPMRVKEFAEAQGAEFSPTLIFYGKGGERILRVVGYQSPGRFGAILDYVTGGHFRTAPLGNYLRNHAEQASTSDAGMGLRPDPLFSKPPHALDRSRFPASGPLLVIFEEAGCVPCEVFHGDVLGAAAVRDALSRFEVVRLDAGDGETAVIAPDGARTTPASWYAREDFSRAPALLFFNETGDEVLKTDALVQKQRMTNALLFVLERAYEKGWTYQRFARSRGLASRE